MPSTRCGSTRLVEVLALLRLLHLAGDLERQPGLHRDGDGTVRALVRTQPAEEEEVLAPMRLARDRPRSRARSDSSRSSSGRASACAGSSRSRSVRRRGATRADHARRSRRARRRAARARCARPACRRRRAERRAEHAGVIVDDVELVCAAERRTARASAPRTYGRSAGSAPRGRRLTSFALVWESPDANSVTSWPASTSPSARSETIHSIPP